MTDPTPFLAAAGLTVQRPDGTLQRVEFADGASWNADTHRVIDRLAAADDTATSDTATSREAAVESNARQVIADLTAGRVGSQTQRDIADAVVRARIDSAAGRAINRGMERE